MTYRALVVDQQGDDYSVVVRELHEADLPPGDVTIRVEWSSVNYKDGLACVAGNRVIRRYPMVPGVDLAGVVLNSTDSRYRAGDSVVVTCTDAGTAHPGGFAELARVPGDWVTPLPPGLTTKEAMALGTAGFTAAQSVETLERFGLQPGAGTVIVTGATGGVGSTAVSILAGRGYTVAGSTGKAEEHQYLRDLGATQILSREDVSAESTRPLDTQLWAGAVDPVGGPTTAYLIRTMMYGASIALSGLTGGSSFTTTVMPFILRGINLLGIESVNCGRDVRLRIWEHLATDMRVPRLLDSIAHETDLDGVPSVAAEIRAGRVKGRTLVRLS